LHRGKCVCFFFVCVGAAVSGVFFFFFFLLCGCGSGEIVHSCLGDAKVDLGNEERESEALNRV